MTSTAAAARPGSRSRARAIRPVASHCATLGATHRPSSAQTSAVSAPWSRLPAANTPGTDVRRLPSTRGAAVPAIDREPAAPRELVVGHPVAGEHDGVALDDLGRSAPEVGQLDGLDPRAAEDSGHGRTDAERDAEREPGRERERGERLVRRTGCHHRHHRHSGVAQGEGGRVAHVLGADDDGARADRQAARDEPLERAGRQHSARSGSGHEPRGARSFAATGRQHDRAR